MTIYSSPYPLVKKFSNDGVINSVFLNNPRINPSNVALIDSISGQQMTYKELISEVLLFADGISRVLKPGQTLLIFTPNSMAYPVLLYAGIAAGVILSTANPAYTASELQHQIESSGATAIAASSDLSQVVKEAAKATGLKESSLYMTPGLDGKVRLNGLRSYLDLRGKEGFKPVKIASPESTPVYLPYSSGTTGKPKGVKLSHKNLDCISQQAINVGLLSEKQVTLGVLPIYHLYGLVIMIHHSFYLGGCVVLMPKFDLKLYCEAIQKYKVSMLMIVPPIALALAKHPIVSEYSMASVKYVCVGAAPVSPGLQIQLEERLSASGKALVVQGFGMTETTAICMLSDTNDPVVGKCGRLIPNMEARLVDEDGKDVAEGEAGELWIRGPNIMMGYTDEKANAETFTPDGWMKTGDVARPSATGDFEIIDRKKELIKTNAYQVAPAELEAILVTCPLVADCAVIGIWSDAKQSEFPRAYVTLSPGITESDKVKEDISQFLAKQVAPYKRLGAGVHVVQEIPKSPSGKILRRDLRVLAAKEAGNSKL
ncbi:acetyl-CoA synthetase-like protein [Meredithblackwellia eburnea MCA 4105]